MNGVDEFVYLRSCRTEPFMGKWRADMPINDDGERMRRRVLQSHNLKRGEIDLTLDELAAKYPYVQPPEEPKWSLKEEQRACGPEPPAKE